MSLRLQADHNKQSFLDKTQIDNRRIRSIKPNRIVGNRNRNRMNSRSLGFLPRGGPAVAMGIASLTFVGAVFYSHDSQVRDRETMKAGVERDKERIKQKRRAKQQQQRPQQSLDHE